MDADALSGPRLLPGAAVLHCQPGNTVHRTSAETGQGEGLRKWRGHRRWVCARGPRRKPVSGDVVLSSAVCCPGGHSCPLKTLGLWSSLWRAGPARVRGEQGAPSCFSSPRGCSLRPPPCILSAQGPRGRVLGLGTSEPYLLFLKESLTAFCNCTVDKCSKRP